MSKATFVIVATAIALLAISCSAAEEHVEQKPKIVKLNDTVKELNSSFLAGKWYDIFATRQVHQKFQKACVCASIVIRPESMGKNKTQNESQDELQNQSMNNIAKMNSSGNQLAQYFVSTVCFNQSTNKLVTANGTLEQASQLFPGAFRISFKDIKNSEQNKTGGDSKDGEKEEDEEDESSQNKANDTSLRVGPNGINFLVMHIAPQKEAMLIAGPSLQDAWILSKKQNATENDVRSLLDFARKKGFSQLSKSACPADVRQRMQKMKST